ncbi:hypothetical protein ANO11243_071720 [Dothideomycetidae sp. 11243]|nr:hypothetical protein ANO11243_071720 [fungal sp. No.11243]
MANASTQQQRLLSVETGTHPITVSAPGIHYSTTVSARAIVHTDCVYFVAYNKTYTKRVLHALKLQDKLSLYEPRPFYNETFDKPQGTISIFDLLIQEFSEDPPAIHMLLPPRPSFLGLSYEPRIKEMDAFEAELFTMSNKLPCITRGVTFRAWPPPHAQLSHAKFRTIFLTGDYPEQGPLYMDGYLLYIEDEDIKS